ncbi:hypothetical protein O7606_26050 [Micromonospora sp. WMMD882]|uniref:hypothetical protein n=1 Tax=Micromonospora sp. WMMD882 TaxID=3015151 RepID=UPI00248AAFE8|nr:hypothetical protein [Micromonospora sp. WMMD882]WBB79571.1 hypothetical protein O7606_26050 [Micromonospora sp. WMMD882]
MSYSRRDNSLERLVQIEALLGHLKSVYIDDLHHPHDIDRHFAVTCALEAAGTFIAVVSPNYLHTLWTRFEASEAARRGVPLLLLTGTDTLRPARYDELVAVAGVDVPPDSRHNSRCLKAASANFATAADADPDITVQSG